MHTSPPRNVTVFFCTGWTFLYIHSGGKECHLKNTIRTELLVYTSSVAFRRNLFISNYNSVQFGIKWVFGTAFCFHLPVITMRKAGSPSVWLNCQPPSPFYSEKTHFRIEVVFYPHWCLSSSSVTSRNILLKKSKATFLFPCCIFFWWPRLKLEVPLKRAWHFV